MQQKLQLMDTDFINSITMLIDSIVDSDNQNQLDDIQIQITKLVQTQKISFLVDQLGNQENYDQDEQKTTIIQNEQQVDQLKLNKNCKQVFLTKIKPEKNIVRNSQLKYDILNPKIKLLIIAGANYEFQLKQNEMCFEDTPFTQQSTSITNLFPQFHQVLKYPGNFTTIRNGFRIYTCNHLVVKLANQVKIPGIASYQISIECPACKKTGHKDYIFSNSKWLVEQDKKGIEFVPKVVQEAGNLPNLQQLRQGVIQRNVQPLRNRPPFVLPRDQIRNEFDDNDDDDFQVPVIVERGRNNQILGMQPIRMQWTAEERNDIEFLQEQLQQEGSPQMKRIYINELDQIQKRKVNQNLEERGFQVNQNNNQIFNRQDEQLDFFQPIQQQQMNQQQQFGVNRPRDPNQQQFPTPQQYMNERDMLENRNLLRTRQKQQFQNFREFK